MFVGTRTVLLREDMGDLQWGPISQPVAFHSFRTTPAGLAHAGDTRELGEWSRTWIESRCPLTRRMSARSRPGSAGSAEALGSWAMEAD
jgi:hypothetical protein